MSGPNPFSTSNAPQHNLVSKILTSPLVGAPYQVVVDLVDIHTAYPLQVGSSTNPVQLEYLLQLGTPATPVKMEFATQIGNKANPVSEIDVQQLYATGIGSEAFPVEREYVTQIGSGTFPTTDIYATNLGSTAHPVVQEYVTQIGDTGASGTAYFSKATIGTLYCSDIIPRPGGGSGGVLYEAGPGIGITYPTADKGIISSLVRGSTGIGLTLGTDNYWDISLDVIGGTGIALTATGDTYTIQNTGVISVTGGTGIAVDNTDPQNPKIYSTAQSGITGISGGTGIQILNGSSQFPTIFTNNIQNVSAGSNVTIDFTNPLVPKISASGGGGSNPTGPTGQIPYFTPTGLLSVPQLTYDGTTLNAPSIEIVSQSQTGMIGFATSAGESSIFSGLTNNAKTGNYLSIGQFQGPPTMTLDTFKGFVGIDKTPSVALDVAGQTVITYNGNNTYVGVTGGSGATGSCVLAAGATYIVRAWGAGGAGNGGVGGAGGYAEVTLSGGTGGTFTWSQLYGGASGGGNALTVNYGAGPILYVPGGGAGVTGGVGAAAGETAGSPQPEGGVSSNVVGITATASCTFTTPWKYNVTSDLIITPGYTFSSANFGISGGTFTSGGSIYGTVATILPGTTGTVTFTPSAPLQTMDVLIGTTYYANPGTTINIQGSFIFSGVTFQSNPGTLQIPENTAIQITDGGAGTTGTGTALFDNWPINSNTPIFTNAVADLTSGLPIGPGIVTLITPATGITFTSDQIGVTWFFASHNLTEVGGNHTITIGAGSTMAFPGYLVGITNSVISTTGEIILPSGTELDVASREFISYGVPGTTSQSELYGGGGYVAGGEPALIKNVPGVSNPVGPPSNRLAGGGAGSWFLAGGVTGITYGGSGFLPYVSEYNRYGVYGAGTTGSTGNAGFLIVEQVITPTVPQSALTVNGNTDVNGGGTFTTSLNVGGTATVNSLVVYGDGQINQNFLQNGNSGAGFGATFNSPLYASAGFTVTGGITGSTTLTVGGTVTFAGGNVLGSTGGAGWILTGTNGTATCTLAQNQTTNLLLSSTPVSAPDFTATSDIRVKTKVETVDSALEKVLKLRGVYFEKITDPGKRHVGVIAQEIEEILPEVVHTDGEDGIKSVSYGSIVGLLIEAIKEQQKMIKKLM